MREKGVQPMTSEKQIAANRQNALKSTGPKTPRGKAIAKMNALKHGLLSSQVLIAGEKARDLAELSQLLRAELRPAGMLEQILVDRIVAGVWRLRRCLRLEAQVVEHEEASVEPFSENFLTGATTRRTPAEMKGLRALRVTGEGERLERMMRYESAIERQIYKALAELEKLRQPPVGPLRGHDRIIQVEPIPQGALPAPESAEEGESKNGFVR